MTVDTTVWYDIWSGLTHEATAPPSPVSHSSQAAIMGFTAHADYSYVSAGITCADVFPACVS